MTVRVVLLVLAVLMGLTGCGTASAPSPPAGVDELVIPTASPDPADFVAGVDNPWLSLEAGSRWTYDVNDAQGTHTMTVAVEDGPTVAGVATTARVSTEPKQVVTDYFAQDDAGNVWWFGRRGSWEAGADGAEPGLAMPARPRVGDGYREAYAPGVVEDAARVLALDESAVVPAGRYDDLLLVEVRSPLEPGATREESYAEGVGLVTENVVSGSYRTVRLTGVTGH
jgi:hypothetical protein